VVVAFGDGKHVYEFESINSHVMEKRWNQIVVVFRTVSGWCDIFINGQISNRKQFPKRHTINFPNKECYIGKYVDHHEFIETRKKGVFHGYMKKLEFHGRELSFDEIKKAFHNETTSFEMNEESIERKLYANDVQRPQYHLIAPGKWMNETHGPIFYDGKYHIFYQANPHAPLWDHIQWGHLVSEDMVFWKDKRLALETDAKGIDPDGCWSGSSCLDEHGVPILYYTAGNNNKFPNQSVACAVPDFSKGQDLEYWIKDSKLLLEQQKEEGWLGEYRDPFVWREEEQFFMLIGTGDAAYGGGNALIYTSTDGKHWMSKGFVMDYSYLNNKEVGHVWELPVLLPLKDEIGEIKCHILLLCACQIDGDVVETYYWLGKWNPEQCRFYPNHEKARLIDLGNGTFTGPSGFVTPDGRSILFTLAQGKRNQEDEFHSGWAHNGGLPLELSYGRGQLQIKPIDELKKLEIFIVMDFKEISIEDVNRRLQEIYGNRFHMEITVDVSDIGIVTCGNEQAPEVYYDKKTFRFGARENVTKKELGKYRGPIDDVVIDEELLMLSYYLDYSMIEVYVNHQKSITLRNYIQGEHRTIQITGDPKLKIKSFVLWEMKSAY
ncbi:MAG: glycoside hydrolase family 32 protein, partial [Vallitaleaceae bacterium]|nr:glycoside hydrolase family 32 protein [Vallitaleaceae bacterium]